MNLSIKLLALTVLTLLASPGYCAEKPKQKWYRVEVIIFTQKDVFGDELSPRDIELTYPENLIELNNNRLAYTPLANSERKLGPDAYSLNRTGVYKVLYHQAWKQPGLAPAHAPWVNIDISNDNTALSGSLRVYLSSYLHMESNLWYITYASPPETANSLDADPLASAPETQAPQPELAPWPTPPRSPLVMPVAPPSDTRDSNPFDFIAVENSTLEVQQREVADIILLKQASRLKLNKLHYFDHPKMGLLFKVSRTTAPVIESVNDTKTEEPSAISKALN